MGIQSLSTAIGLFTFLLSYSVAHASKCTRPLSKVGEPEWAALWEATASGVAKLSREVLEGESLLRSIETAVLAHNFALIAGPPGSGKTYAASKLLKAEIRGLNDKDKKLFFIQMHQLISEGYFTGFQNIERLIEGDGKQELKFQDSLINEDYVFLLIDEAEKTNPAVLVTLLSLLQERKAFLGGETKDIGLLAGVFTSNSSIEAILNSFKRDRTSGQAFVDRAAIKYWALNKFAEQANRRKLLEGNIPNDATVKTHLASLHSLLERVQIPDPLLDPIAQLIFDLDIKEQERVKTALRNKAEEYSGGGDGTSEEVVTDHHPANQFTNRSNRTLVLDTLKASFLLNQLTSQVPFAQIRWTLEPKDVVHLATGALLQGPGNPNETTLSLDLLIRGEGGEHSLQVVGKNKAVWNPYQRELSWNDVDTGRRKKATFDPKSSKWTGDGAELLVNVVDPNKTNQGINNNPKAIANEIRRWEEVNREKLKHPSFEDDGMLEKLLTLEHLSAEDKKALKRIQAERDYFIRHVNEIVKRTPTSQSRPNRFNAVNARIDAIKKRNQMIRDLKAKLVAGDIQSPTQVEYRRKLIELSYANLQDAFPNSEYIFRAILEAAVSDQHVQLFGGPGGAKTMIARTVLQGLVDALKFDGTDNYLWIQQFHKMVPEGKINGVSNFKARKEGRDEIDVEGTLVDPKVHYAIADEFEKSHPGVAAAGLGVTNERSAPRGSKQIPSNVKTLVFTTNQMPSEWYESFGEMGKGTARATFDRISRKVYVKNKFGTPEELADFLKLELSGAAREVEVFLPIDYLKGILNSPKAPKVNESVFNVADAALNKFIARNNKREKETFFRPGRDEVTDPYWILSPSQGSERTRMANHRAWKSGALLDAALRGKSSEEMPKEMTFMDLGEAAGAVRHQHSGQIETVYDNKSGVVQFKLKPSAGDLNHFEERDQFLQKEMEAELKDWIATVNAEITSAYLKNRDLISKFPHLFPNMMKSGQER